MKKVLYGLLLTVFVLTFSAGNADAAWSSSFTTAKKILANADSTKLTAVSAANTIAYTLGAGETMNTNDVLVVTLSGGAKFSATAPILSGSGAGAFTIVGSATGLTSANFRAAKVQPVGTTINLNTTGTIFNVSAVTGNVDVQFYAYTSVGSLTIFDKLQSTKAGAAFGFGSSAMESVYIVANTNTADVSATGGAFTRFTTGLVGLAPTYSYKNLSEGANTVPNGQQISIGKVIFNISGNLAGITTIGVTVGTCTGSSSAGVQGTGVADFFLIDTAKTNAYCFNTAVIAPQGTVSLAPVFTLDGTTAQAARGFNASVAVLDDGTKWDAHTALAATALYSITRNGSSFVTNSVGARNKIKITDRSGGIGTGGGAITVTARDASGTALTEVTGAPALSLANNATTEILGTDLAARFTGTPMRYDFSVESSEIVVTNVKYNADSTMNVTTIFTTTASQGI